MKTIVAANAGVLSAKMKARVDRLRRTTLQAQLVQSSLWKPVRLAPVPQTAAGVKVGATQALAASSRPAASVRRAVSRPPVSAARSAAIPGRMPTSAGRTRSALLPRSGVARPATGASVALRRAIAQRSAVAGPVSPGGNPRSTPSLQTVARELTRRNPSREASTSSGTGGGARTRLAAPVAQGAHRSRPASDLAAQTDRVGGRRSAATSAASPTLSPSGNSAQGTPRAGFGADAGRDNGGGDNGGAGDNSGGDNGGGAIVLAGNLLVDGRRIGEMAASSAARSGSSAQTAARSPNFRSTALPSGLSAPLP